MDSIFEALNNTKIDLNDYETYELNDIEKKNMKKNLRKALIKRRHSLKSKAVIIASVVFVLMSTSNFIGNDVLAYVDIIGTKIESFINYKGNSLEDYKTVVNKEITKNEILVKLNEVIFDGQEVLISSTFKSDKINWKGIEVKRIIPDVYVNGKHLGGSGGRMKTQKIDDSTYDFLDTVNIGNINLKDNSRIKIVYNGIRDNGDNAVSGRWVFEFTASKDALSEKVKMIPIGREFVLEGGQQITIENLRISPISTTISYTMVNGTKYDTHFIVKDQDGKEIQLGSGQTMSKDNYLRGSALDKKTTKLQITPYLISGYEGEKKTDFRKVLEEESFEVDVKNLVVISR
jgi:hypothetical protein